MAAIRATRASILFRTLLLCGLLGALFLLPFTADEIVPGEVLFVLSLVVGIPTIIAVQRGWTRFMWASRIERLREKVDAAPNDPEAHYELGILSAAHGQLKDARAAFERARAIAPNHAGATVGLGHVHAQENDYEEALRLFQIVATADPQSFAAHYGLGGVYVQQDQFARAIAAYEKALAVDSDDTFTLAQLARCHLVMGNPQRAEEYRVRAESLGLRDRDLERQIRASYPDE